jgi:hypothetical protein
LELAFPGDISYDDDGKKSFSARLIWAFERLLERYECSSKWLAERIRCLEACARDLMREARACGLMADNENARLALRHAQSLNIRQAHRIGRRVYRIASDDSSGDDDDGSSDSFIPRKHPHSDYFPKLKFSQIAVNPTPAGFAMSGVLSC